MDNYLLSRDLYNILLLEEILYHPGMYKNLENPGNNLPMKKPGEPDISEPSTVSHLWQFGNITSSTMTMGRGISSEAPHEFTRSYPPGWRPEIYRFQPAHPFLETHSSNLWGCTWRIGTQDLYVSASEQSPLKKPPWSEKGHLEGEQRNPIFTGKKTITMVINRIYPSPGMILQATNEDFIGLDLCPFCFWWGFTLGGSSSPGFLWRQKGWFIRTHGFHTRVSTEVSS